MQSENKLTIPVNQPLQKSELKVVVLSEIRICPWNSNSLSYALGNLKEECIQTQKVLNASLEDLQENIDPDLTGNEDFVSELIGLDNTDNLLTFIDLDTLNNADITLEQDNYENTNVIQDNNIFKGFNANEIGDQTDFENNVEMNAAKRIIPG